MPKIAYFTILGILLLAAVTVFNITGVNASEETKFVQVSVLAKDRADYGVDENMSTIPAVSPAIIEDKVHDIGSATSETVKIIKYTTLPPKNSGPAGEADERQIVDKPEPKREHGNNGNSITNQNQNQNQNINANNNSNKDKDKVKDKDKDKVKDKETKPDKTAEKPTKPDRTAEKPTKPDKTAEETK
ncbi:MAG: hypothetical protein JW730_04195 [Anaerolineales bacterium]|nr:hypothetical protein [Anaerolineales bacterium]